MVAKQNRVDREGVDTILLVAAFILGVGLAVGLKWLDFAVWVPALASATVIISYAVITYVSSSARLEPEQIGDNCYYLGFCITLASLAWTLYGLGSAAGDAALINDVISGFGVALSSTVVGVMARVILLQFRVDLAAREKEARSDLNKVMREFFGEIRATVASTTEMRTQIRQSLEEHTEQMIDQNLRMQGSFDKRVEKLVESVGTGIQAAMDEVVESGKDMNRRIAASSRANITISENALVSSMETVVSDLKRTAVAFDKGMEEANSLSVKALEKVVSDVTEMMTLLTKETQKSIQDARNTQSEESTRAIQAVSANIFELANEISRQKDTLGAAIGDYTLENKKALESLREISIENERIQSGTREIVDRLTGTASTIEEAADRINKIAVEPIDPQSVNVTSIFATETNIDAPLVVTAGLASGESLPMQVPAAETRPVQSLEDGGLSSSPEQSSSSPKPLSRALPIDSAEESEKTEPQTVDEKKPLPRGFFGRLGLGGTSNR